MQSVQQEKLANGLTAELEKVREACENDFYTFMCVLNPYRYFGEIHREVADWLGDPFGSHNKLLLLPRDHQKSFIMANFVCWVIAKDPAATFLYLSATATLAEKQLYQIKQILTSDKFVRLWPHMLHPEEGRRDKWTNTEINVDHPIRAELGIRDSTVLSAGISKVIAGLHPRYIISDDLVVRDNAYTEEGRQTLRTMYSFLASLESSDGWNIAAGTRYQDKDLYHDMITMEEDTYNAFGECIGSRLVYDVLERVVETDGVFLWPRRKAKDGKEYGFDWPTLSTKKAKYLDKSQFYAQYYNNCNMGEGRSIPRTWFNYFDRKHLNNIQGKWYFQKRRLNIYAAIDFAFSLTKGADWTALVVVGIDHEGFIYVLLVDRFKTDQLDVYFEHIEAAYNKYGFKKIRGEVNVAQGVIVKYLKRKFTEEGLLLAIEEFKQPNKKNEKEERSFNTLHPRYKEGKILHPREGAIDVLEEELVLMFPPHDDCKDGLTGAIEIAVPPPRSHMLERGEGNGSKIIYNDFFGGYQGRRINVR